MLGSDAIPPLYETPEALQQSSETFYGYVLDGQGGRCHLSYKREEKLLNIYCVRVHPDWFRREIARTLLAFGE